MLLKGFIFAALFVNIAIGACGIYENSATLLSFRMGSFELRNPAQSPAYESSIAFQGLVLSLDDEGKLKVEELLTNQTLWAWGSNGKNCLNSGCRVSFQSDSNLIIYYPDGTNITANYTPAGSARLLRFSVTSPYITLLNGPCATLWPKLDSDLLTIPKDRNTRVLGETSTVTVNELQAIPASDWRNRSGINTHVGFGKNATKVLAMLKYVDLGIFRDGIWPQWNWTADFGLLVTNGFKANFGCFGNANQSLLTPQVNRLATFETMFPGTIINIEGFNEVDRQPFVYNLIDPTVSYSGILQAQKDFYSMIKANSKLSHIPVLDFTITTGSFLDTYALGFWNYSGRADFGAFHRYGSGGQPSISIGGTNDIFKGALNDIYPGWKSFSDFTMSETGYHTSIDDGGVSELAHSKMIINSLLNGFSYNLRQTYLYELWDSEGQPGAEAHFGVFYADTTPKPGAKALHFASEILRDYDTPSNPGKLSFALEGFPVGGRHFLFQKANSTYYLALWNTAAVWNPSLKTDIINNSTDVVLRLASSAIFQVFNPYLDSDDSLPLPPIITQRGSSVTFPFRDSALFVSVTLVDDPITNSDSNLPAGSSIRTTVQLSGANGFIGINFCTVTLMMLTIFCL